MGRLLTEPEVAEIREGVHLGIRGPVVTKWMERLLEDYDERVRRELRPADLVEERAEQEGQHQRVNDAAQKRETDRRVRVVEPHQRQRAAENHRRDGGMDHGSNE
jgi:hypothetical protein